MRRHAGSTLVELLVALTVLGMLLGLSAFGVGSLRPHPTRSDDVRRAQARALRTGVAITLDLDGTAMRFLPDGRAIGAGLDPRTGTPASEPTHARH